MDAPKLIALDLHLKFNKDDDWSPWVIVSLQSVVVPVIGQGIEIDGTHQKVVDVVLHFDPLHPYGEHATAYLEASGVLHLGWKAWRDDILMLALDRGWRTEDGNPYESQLAREQGWNRSPDDHPQAPIVRNEDARRELERLRQKKQEDQ